MECRFFNNIKPKCLLLQHSKIFFDNINPNTIFFKYLKDLYNYLKWKYTSLYIYSIFIIYLCVIATFIYFYLFYVNVEVILLYVYSI